MKEKFNLKNLRRCLVGLLLMCALPMSMWADKTISGMVSDMEGEPLPGATVREIPTQEKASIAMVMVDFNGHFHINVPESTKELEVSFVGFTPKVVKLLDNEKVYDIRLEPMVGTLDEVVVTGYQTISKERSAGSFEKVNASTLQTQRLSGVESMLEGHVAGFSDGRIRGVTSMNGVSTPLYVIDGFPVEKTTNDGYSYNESVPDINPEDIESITVLKDAAATSIYGARAANGVVVITTKRAAKGTLNVSFSTTLTFQPYRTYTGHLADAATMIGLEKEWAAQNPYLQGDATAYATNLLSSNQYPTPGIRAILQQYAGLSTEAQTQQTLAALAAKGYSYYSDLDRLTKQNPFYQQYNISVSRGAENNNFLASLSFQHNQFSDKYTKDHKVGINIQNSTEITRWLTFDAGAYINFSGAQTQSYDLTSPGFTVMPYMSLEENGAPFISRQEDRYADYQLLTLQNYGLYNLDINPLEETGYGLTKSTDFSARAYARLLFKLTDWLRFNAQFQYEASEIKTTQLQEKESYAVRNKVNNFATQAADGSTQFNLPYGNIYNQMRNSARNYNLRLQLDFNKNFGEHHELTALAGFEMRENKLDYDSQNFYNYDPDLLTYSLIDQKTLTTTNGLWGWGWFGNSDVAQFEQLLNRFVSFYANAAYAYDYRYLLNASIRWDRTNLFGTSSKYQNHPTWSVGAGWRINEEKFFDVEWVNNLKFRLSYGVGGNIAKDSAPYMTTYVGNNTHVGDLSANVSTRPNPNLRWEKTTTFNVGFDFSLLNNRLSGSIEYYDKRGSDLLANTMGVPTEGWGYSTYTINNGKMTNRGVELNLNATPYADRDWTWNVGVLLGYNHNKVTYVNVEAPVLFLLFDYATAYPRIGNPYNAIYAYDWAGLDENGMSQVYDHEGNIVKGQQPSSVDDAVYAGSYVPKLNGSISTSLRWKQFELSAMFLYSAGHKVRNTLAPYLSSFGPVSADIANRWQQPGDEAFTDIPAYISQENPLYNYYNAELYTNSTACVVSADNFRLRNLSLSYTLPQNVVKRLSLQSIRLMVGMENVFTICRNKSAKYLMGGYDRPNYMFSLQLHF